MSTHEHKVKAVYDFLRTRAALGRVTTHEEVGVVIGRTLAERKQRRIDRPVRREKVQDALRAVDEQSFEEKGVLLSALVAHFWDDNASRKFIQRASEKGLYLGNVDPDSWGASHRDAVYAAYPEVDEVIPDDASEICTACGQVRPREANEGRHHRSPVAARVSASNYDDDDAENW